MAKGKRETVEMVDGRTYSTDDNWTTVYVQRRGGKRRLVTDDDELATARICAVAQSSAGRG